MMKNHGRSGKRCKKRKFAGNKFTIQIASDANCSASAKKLNSDLLENNEVGDYSTFQGYRILDIKILFKELEDCVVCKICGGSVKVKEDAIHGLSSKFSVHCQNCKELTSFRSSEMLGDKKNVAEINRRAVYAMRCLGQGLTGLQTFCGVMDLPAPVSQKSYEKIIQRISTATNHVAQHSMKTAAAREASLTGGNDVTISGDGTWKTRGHTSLTGVCTAIGAETGKVIDIEVMSSYCRGCLEWKGPRDGDDYIKWKESHLNKCVKNHDGSAGKMEVDGMCKIFQRSESERGVRYVNYIGDGDTKTFLAISSSKPYGTDVNIAKIECVGHVQKRMGTRLRKCKVNMRTKKLEDGKSIGGKGRLTDKEINLITVYYGNAIRSNKGSLANMRKAVWAIFFHKRSNDDEPTHHFCPDGVASWCEYKRSVANGTVATFKHTRYLPACVMDAIKPVFKDLSSPDLLGRCLSGQTQNPNESLNSTIWKYCPKTSGSGRHIVDMAVNEAVVMFNEGFQGRLKTMHKLGLIVGDNVKKIATLANECLIRQAEKRLLSCTYEARRAKRRKAISDNELFKKLEGEIYSPGCF